MIDCDFQETPNGDGTSQYTCTVCKRPMTFKSGQRLRRNCKVDDPTRPKPGTELKLIFQSLSVQQIKGCTCEAIAAEMDRLGADGCRRHRDNLLWKLGENYNLYGLGDKLKAGALAFVKWMPMNIEGLFDLAIERAEEKTVQSKI